MDILQSEKDIWNNVKFGRIQKADAIEGLKVLQFYVHAKTQ